MHPLLLESFDFYGRYLRVAELRQSLGEQRIKILDVGDPFGTIAHLFPDDQTVSADIYADEPPKSGGHHHVMGSGFELPFPDRSFDLVASHDTFEHLQASRRLDFVDELLRVAAGPVLLAAPFADPRTARCEALVNSYFAARLGETIPALDEHAAFGLPDLGSLVSSLRERSLEHRVFADGWLYHWVAFWYLKAHLTDEARPEDTYRLHGAFNQLLRGADRRGPHYRRFVVIGSDSELDLPPPQEDGDVAADLEALTDLSVQLGQVLVRGDDPFHPGSLFAGWVSSKVESEGPLGEVARSLATAVDAVREAHTALAQEPVAEPVEPRRLPSVTVVIVNLDGAHHLPACLDSLAAQDYPGELFDVLVVDNGSTDGSRELLARDYPSVRVLAQEANIGFAPAVEVAARAVDTECLALVNNDMRVSEDWLSQLVVHFDPEDRVPCVGGRILSWDGQTVDFVRPSLSFAGLGRQVGMGRAPDSVATEDGEEILFACGGSMLVDRATYLNSGGFDPGFFAYFEDVDFGWRLWVLGFRVKLATKAVSYHRHHGTASRFPHHQRTLLLERNALRSLIKNYDDDNLSATLGPAVMLLVARAVARGDLDRAPYDIGGDRKEHELVPRLVLAHLHAVVDVVEDLPVLLDQRAYIQRGRQRPDSEIVERFGHPFHPPADEVRYLQAQEKVVSAFQLDRRFGRGRARRVLIVTSDDDGDHARGGAGARAGEIARSLAQVTHVTLVGTSPPRGEVGDVGLATYGSEDELRALGDTADVIVVSGSALARGGTLIGALALLVADLSDPWLFDNLAGPRFDGDAHRRLGVDLLNEVLDGFDAFICASERQRDYWLGILAGRGRVDEVTYRHDPSLRELIDVVLPSTRPDRAVRRRSVLKGVKPAVGADDLVVVCDVGPWDWLDPLMLLEAMDAVVDEVPNAKLCVVLASAGAGAGRLAAEVEERAKNLRHAGSVVVVDEVPEEDRPAYLLEADVAVSPARDVAEARLSPGVHVMDYLWCGLPVVTTDSDATADLVRDQRLGAVVPPGDASAMARALVRLLRDPLVRSDCSARARVVTEDRRVRASTEPLRRMVATPWRWEALRHLRRGGRALTDDVRLLLDDRTRQAREREAESAALRQRVSELEAIVHPYRHLLSRRVIVPLRATPAHRLLRVARRARRWARGRAGTRPVDGPGASAAGAGRAVVAPDDL